MKVIISAGGKGTRISSIANDIPKPMIKIGGKPVLEHELENIRKQGFTDILITIGHLGHVIRDYFGDGSKLGIKIEYFEEKEPLGTAGALYYLKDKLTEDFLLLNGDSIMDVNFNRMINFHKEHKADVTLLTHPNSHPYDSALIIADSNTHKVIQWMNKEEERTVYKNRVNAGVHIISPKVLEGMHPGKTDLDREILKPLVSTGNVYAYDSPEYIKDMGTPERYRLVCNDFEKGKVQAKNLKNPQRAVFLDRDGTLNVYKGFITKYKDIELMGGVVEAVKAINESGYLAIVVSNQPVIARGECTFEELEEINNKLETELGLKGAYIDDLFFCPHHPDKGFEGERTEYKIKCSCRKPEPGLLLKAAEKYNIDLSKSYMVGDSVRDVQAGQRAGCKSVYIGDKDIEEICIRCGTLEEFVNIYIKNKN